VAVVAMEDGDNRNMFSPGLISDLQAAFAEVRRRAEARVVVVHGYASWFCSGGTPATLEEIRSGQAAFTDSDVFRLLLDCELPTIAAMQGHALGGGLTFGLYADIPLMAEHAFYAGNFMSHGFTPGVGATYLFPAKLGKVIGAEMLFTARRYRGSELRERGVEVQVLGGAEVIPRALEIARELADKPLLQLKLLKRRLSQAVRRGVAHAVDEELMMHRLIFQTDGWGAR
jgi:polyketide biosynthesis enoyl-CoA hydratase PksI